jgi:hypothetical protein
VGSSSGKKATRSEIAGWSLGTAGIREVGERERHNRAAESPGDARPLEQGRLPRRAGGSGGGGDALV